MKVLIVEEALKTLHGHWFQYISDIVNGGKAAGLQIEVAVHKDACPEILSALPCRPILRNSVFGTETNPPTTLGSFKRVFTHNVSLYRDLRDFLAAGNTYDLVIATTPRLEHLLAYECLHWNLRGGKTRFVLIFIDSVGRYSRDFSTIQFGRKSIFFKYALKFSRKLPNPDQFLLMAESAGMAKHYQMFCGCKFGLVPHVTTLPSLEPYRKNYPQPTGPSKPKILGTYGFTRYDKGLDILHSAIRQFPDWKVNPPATFVLQWIMDYKLPDGRIVQKDSDLEASKLVKYIPGFSSSSQYYQCIADTDIMVLPYRRQFYHDRLSRVAIDAALAGIPLVCPAGTWLEWFLDHYAAGILFQPENPKSLALAISESIDRYDELKKDAEARKAATADAFSAEAFFKSIAGHPGLVLGRKLAGLNIH